MDSSVSSLAETGQLCWNCLTVVSLCCSYTPSNRHWAWRELTGDGGLHQPGYRALRLPLGLEWCPSPALTYKVLRHLSACPIQNLPASVQLHAGISLRFSTRTKPAPASRLSARCASCLEWLLGHLLRPCSPGLGQAFLNHPPQRHPYSPTTFNLLCVFLLKLYLQSTYHFLTFISLFSYFRLLSPLREESTVKEFALLIVLISALLQFMLDLP